MNPPSSTGASFFYFPRTSRTDRPRFRLSFRVISVENQVQGGDLNLYEGLRCHGVPLVTISRGRLVYENGLFTCAEGSGKFCPLRTFPDYLYKKMVQREKVPQRNRRVHSLDGNDGDGARDRFRDTHTNISARY